MGFANSMPAWFRAVKKPLTNRTQLNDNNSVSEVNALKRCVRAFWENSPCDSWFTNAEVGTHLFYEEIDAHRYRVHWHLLATMDFPSTRDLRVLEIGCGVGCEAARFARAGAIYTGFDLTAAAVALTQRRFKISGLPGRFIQGDAENLPFADASFDLVYSHGVLHHTPDTKQAIHEIYRVLRPGGKAIVMLYNQQSFNYQINICVLRRLRTALLTSQVGINLLGKIFGESIHDLQEHARYLRQDAKTYLASANLLNRNTDGPGNPLSQVFTRRAATELFRDFKVDMQVHFWNPRWIPVIGNWLPRSFHEKLASRWGWHLWLFGQKPRTFGEA